MNNLAKNIAAVAGLGLFAAGANAAIIPSWDFTVTAGFDTAATTFDADTGGSTVNTAQELSWGATGGDATAGDTGDAEDNRSALIWDQLVVTGNFATGTTATTATLTHWNNPILGTYKSLLSASIDTTLTLTGVPAGPALAPISRSFAFSFKETPNRNNCGFPSASNCDDIFVVDIDDLSDSFVIDGVEYTAFVTTDGLGDLPASACDAAGVTPPCGGLQTRESEQNVFAFEIGVTARELPVPAPATVALFGLGLIGLGAARRRKA
jgi:hypothetical protein